MLRKLWLRKLQPLDVQSILFKAAYIDFMSLAPSLTIYFPSLILSVLMSCYFHLLSQFSLSITRFIFYLEPSPPPSLIVCRKVALGKQWV